MVVNVRGHVQKKKVNVSQTTQRDFCVTDLII